MTPELSVEKFEFKLTPLQSINIITIIKLKVLFLMYIHKNNILLLFQNLK